MTTKDILGSFQLKKEELIYLLHANSFKKTEAFHLGTFCPLVVT